MKKRILSLVLAAVMILTLFPMASATDEDFTIQDGVLIGYHGSDSDVVIPDGVTTIGRYAFLACYNVTSVTVPSSVTTIEQGAFSYCAYLTDVTLFDGLTTIGEEAFAQCYKLKNVWIPDSVTTIGRNAFSSSGLKSVTIPGHVTSLGELAFHRCESLTSATIENGVTTIGGHAFGGCYELTSVNIPDSVTAIGESAFSSCSSLTSLTIPVSVKKIGKDAFDGCRGLTEIHYEGSPEEWKEISEGKYTEAFLNAIQYGTPSNGGFKIQDGLLVKYTGSDSDVVIPDGVTEIGDQAFSSGGLTSVTIPGSVTAISKEAFGWCYDLTSITVAEDNPSYSSRDGVLFNKRGTELVRCPKGKAGSYTVPKGVSVIGENAFDNCNNLTAVTIPKGVTTIGGSAFLGCGKLKSLTIPGSVTKLGEYVIGGCKRLSTVTILDGVTTIGKNAFADCDGLNSVTIPTSVTTIEEGAFDRCPWLGKVSYLGSAKDWRKIKIGSGNGRLLAAHTSFAVSSPAEEGIIVSGDDVLTQYVGSGGNVVIPDGVTSIGDHAFASNHDLTGVTIPNSVRTIGKNAFTNCDNLTHVTIPGSVATIGEGAFSGCSSLTDVTILNGVAEIEPSAFYACTALTSVTIPNSVTAIGEHAFHGCSSLTGVVISDRVTTIEKYAFSGCDSLADVTIPNGVTTIEEDAFFRCAGLTSVTIPRSVTSMGVGAFYECYNLTDVYYGGSPEEWKRLGEDGFGNLSGSLALHYGILPNDGFDVQDGLLVKYNGLNSNVVIPNMVTAIFSLGYNKRITSVTIPGSVTAISKEAFDTCPNLKNITVAAGNSVYSSKNGALLNKAGTELIYCPKGMEGAYSIPAGVTSINDHAFYNCSKLTGVTIPNGVTVIGDCAFGPCDSLTSVTIPGSVTTMENGFRGCQKLNTVVISDGVTTIGRTAFQRCGSLTRVAIPASVTSIEYGAFDQCPELKEVFFGGSQDAWKAITVSGSSNYALLAAAIHFNSIGVPNIRTTFTAKATNDKLTVDGVSKAPTAYKINNANYFQLRDVAVLLNDTKAQFSIEYDNAAKAIKITTGQPYAPNGKEMKGAKATAEAIVGNNDVYINGVKTDFAVYKIGGSNFFQIRDLGKALGFNVDWAKDVGIIIDPNSPYSGK